MFWPFKKLSSREKVAKKLKKHIKALQKKGEFVRVCMEYWFSLKDDENYIKRGIVVEDSSRANKDVSLSALLLLNSWKRDTESDKQTKELMYAVSWRGYISSLSTISLEEFHTLEEHELMDLYHKRVEKATRAFEKWERTDFDFFDVVQ